MLKIKILSIAFFATICLASCSSKEQPPVEKTYPVAKQSRPNQKIFYPVRTVRPELPTAAESRSTTSPRVMIKAFHYQLTDVKICEAAEALAASLSFSNYCAPNLLAQKVTVNQILTPYEFADWLESERSIKVVIDRISRQVRFLQGDIVPPRYPEKPENPSNGISNRISEELQF